MRKILYVVASANVALLSGCSIGSSSLFIALENSGESVVKLDTRRLYPEAESVYISCTNNTTVLGDVIGTHDLKLGHLRDDHKNWIITTYENSSAKVEEYNKFILKMCDTENTHAVQEVTDTTITFEKNNGVWELTPPLI